MSRPGAIGSAPWLRRRRLLRGPSRGRRIAARVLVWLGALLAVVALLAGYVRWQALDTDTVRATADELIVDDAIREQVAASLVDSLFANVDVEAELEQRLPPDQQGLAGVITGAVRELADRAANQMLERPRAQQLWVDTVAFSHGQLINVLKDESQGVTTQGGAVFLDLRPLVVELGNRVPVVGRIAAQLPDDAGLIKVIDADQLETAQDITAALDFLGTWFWVVPLLLFAAAIWLAAGRRRLILRSIAWGSIVAGLLVLVIRRVAGGYVVDSLATTASAEQAAQNAWNILTSLLAEGAWTLIGLAVLVLIGVWFAGPSASGTASGASWRRSSRVRRSRSAPPRSCSCSWCSGLRPPRRRGSRRCSRWQCCSRSASRCCDGRPGASIPTRRTSISATTSANASRAARDVAEVRFVGHATVLVELDGVRLLTPSCDDTSRTSGGSFRSRSTTSCDPTRCSSRTRTTTTSTCGRCESSIGARSSQPHAASGRSCASSGSSTSTRWRSATRSTFAV